MRKTSRKISSQILEKTSGEIPKVTPGKYSQIYSGGFIAQTPGGIVKGTTEKNNLYELMDFDRKFWWKILEDTPGRIPGGTSRRNSIRFSGKISKGTFGWFLEETRENASE